MQLSGNFNSPKTNTLEICCRFTSWFIFSVSNGIQWKGSRKLCAFQTVSNENHFHTAWKNGIPLSSLSSSSKLSSNSQNQLLHFIHKVSGGDDITHKGARLDWSEVLALLNLNKFVCITCEPSRRNIRATFPISSATQYVIFDSPHLRTKPISAHVLHRVYWHTHNHAHTETSSW